MAREGERVVNPANSRSEFSTKRQERKWPGNCKWTEEEGGGSLRGGPEVQFILRNGTDSRVRTW